MTDKSKKPDPKEDALFAFFETLTTDNNQVAALDKLKAAFGRTT